MSDIKVGMDKKKFCSICEKEKSTNFFSKNKSKKDGLQTTCKECASKSFKKYWIENKREHYQYVRKKNDERRLAGRIFCYNFLKEHPCVDCGESDPVVLEFDHQRDKKYDISRMLRNCLSIESIKSEIDKCEVRCANCHRRKTAKDFDWYADIIGSEAQVVEQETFNLKEAGSIPAGPTER